MKSAVTVLWLALAAWGCNKKAAPAASDSGNGQAPAQQTAAPPPAKRFEALPVPSNVQYKQLDISKLKMQTTDTTMAPGNNNVIQPRPVGAPVEAPQKNP